MNAYNGSDDDDDNMVSIKLKWVYCFTEHIREVYLDFFFFIENFKNLKEKRKKVSKPVRM